MKLVDYQEIQQEKIKRQAQIKKLQKNYHGHIVHLGKISPGCRRCFTQEQGSGIQIGTQCMCNCEYCYYDRNRIEHTKNHLNKMIASFFEYSLDDNWKPTIFSYQSYGETLKYIDYIEKIATILEQTAKRTEINQYIFLYTNGLLANEEMLYRLKKCNINEIRFHLGASNFADKVYKNMEIAQKMDFILTVETPSYIKHRKKIFESLPIIENLKVKHLNLVEIQITPYNLPDLQKINKVKVYKDYYYHLYDDGLVYDVIEETINKNYNFSIMDCNSGVERCRHATDYKLFNNKKQIQGVCAKWDYGHNKYNL